MEYTIPYLGKINLKELKEDYYTTGETSKNNFSIELSFEKESIDEKIADGISSFLENIDKQDQHNRSFIAKDFKEKESETSAYLNFFLTEFDEAELLNIVGEKTENTNIAEQLLNKLALTQVALYPDGKYGVSYYAMFDYTIYLDGLPYDQLLVVFTDQQGNLNSIGWDS